ncbi:MAG: DUF4440 domain-containing protein [Nitrosomonas sp.]|nr:DUF4440 domain-containing protein [Nitrosomonas sp.]
MDELAEQIRQLELKLLHMDWRVDPAAIDELLDETFEEIGGNGQISARQNVVGWLLKKDPHQQWALQDFRIKRLSSDTVIAIYRAVKANQLEENGKGSIRSSIWQRFGDHWRMVFHQATTCT